MRAKTCTKSPSAPAARIQPRLLPLDCGVQPYEWGSRAHGGRKPYIASLLCVPAPADKPFAELWIGSHPKLCAKVRAHDANAAATPMPDLLTLIKQDPKRVLGAKLAKAGASGLPFLLKVLSCEQPLSIQAHPDLKLAAALHARDPEHYPDANHKPEIAIAITPFDALCQFRPTAAIRRDLQRLSGLADFIAAGNITAAGGAKAWLRRAYAWIFTAPKEAIATCMATLLDDISQVLEAERTPHDVWFQKIAARYPNDRGAISIYFLNVMHLEPGQAIFMGSNEPHAYLQGDIIECMANSDNVVRAGLTPKFIDRQVLLDMLTYRQLRPTPFKPRYTTAEVTHFEPPVSEFQLTLLAPTPKIEMEVTTHDVVSILLVLDGEVTLETEGETLTAPRGSIWLWPACLGSVIISTRSRRACVVHAQPNLTQN